MRFFSGPTFTLGVLFAINTMNFFDRQVLPAVQERIRRDWGLSDSKLGLLGTAFILLYAAIGVPLGRLADIGSRKYILAAGVGLWSILTVGSGFAWDFWSLFILRLGVGIGEASCAPAATSLIGDLVPPEKRARAMAVFMLGLPTGLALSFWVSGEMAQRYGWSAAFFVAGLPGLVLAGLALRIDEPERARSSPGEAIGAEQPPLSAVVARLLGRPTFLLIIVSGALHNFNMYALGTFLASFLTRYHGMSVAAAGQVSGLVYGGAALGIFGAGWLGDRILGRNAAGRLTIAWIAVAAAVPCLLLALAAPPGTPWACAAWLLPGCTLLYAYYGTIYATIQDIVEPAYRGTAMAVYFCAMYLLGAVLGPVALGWLSDAGARRAARAAGAASLTELHKAIGLHDALYIVPVLNVALALVLFLAMRTQRHSLDRIARESTAM